MLGSCRSPNFHDEQRENASSPIVSHFDTSPESHEEQSRKAPVPIDVHWDRSTPVTNCLQRANALSPMENGFPPTVNVVRFEHPENALLAMFVMFPRNVALTKPVRLEQNSLGIAVKPFPTVKSRNFVSPVNGRAGRLGTLTDETPVHPSPRTTVSKLEQFPKTFSPNSMLSHSSRASLKLVHPRNVPLASSPFQLGGV